jgi:hypothetical protein
MSWSLSEDLRELAHQAFIQFHNQPASLAPCTYGPDLHANHHECTNECPWFEYHRVFICRISGSIHLCTEETCDRYVINREGRPCALTGIIYPLQLNEDNEFMNSAKRIKVSPSSSSSSALSLLQPASSHVNTFRQILFTLMSVKNGTPGKWDEVLLEKQLSSKDVAHAAAYICDHLWQLLYRTAYYQQNAMKYKVDYHGLVVLYQMLDGFEINDDEDAAAHIGSSPSSCLVIVPRIAVMRQVLPPLKCINQTDQWRCALYTPADKFFHACLQEVSNESLRNLDMWMKHLLQRCKILERK